MTVNEINIETSEMILKLVDVTDFRKFSEEQKTILSNKYNIPEKNALFLICASINNFLTLKEKFNKLSKKIYTDVENVTDNDRDEYQNLLGLFFPKFRTDDWINPIINREGNE